MRCLIVFLTLMFPISAFADIASVQHVENQTKTKVDTSANSNQQMAGTYTVTGTLIVPTPELPPKD